MKADKLSPHMAELKSKIEKAIDELDEATGTESRRCFDTGSTDNGYGFIETLSVKIITFTPKKQ